ncbi:MAG: hypothetical protein RI920_39 [Pseudomonadota bacterium]|jgi:hypothetical protein
MGSEIALLNLLAMLGGRSKCGFVSIDQAIGLRGQPRESLEGLSGGDD